MDSSVALACGAALTVGYCLGARSVGGSSAPASSGPAGPTIAVGARMPDGALQVVKNTGGAFKASAESLFKGRTVVLFAVPGAFTPTCSERHLPSFVDKAAALNKAGVHEIMCLSCNDAFVMEAWGLDAKTVREPLPPHSAPCLHLRVLLLLKSAASESELLLTCSKHKQGGAVTMVSDEVRFYVCFTPILELFSA